MIARERGASAADEAAAPSVRPELLRAVLLLAFLGQAVAFFSIRQDDPFITFRYGQNLVLGHGLVFNPGERVLGSTAPGHMLLSALVYAVFGRELTPSVMSLFGCVGWTAQAVAAYFLLLPTVGRLRAAAIAFALQLGAARSFMWVPFETNLVAALSLWAFVAAGRRRFVAAAALAGFASLFRPDALLVAALLGGYCVWHERARALRPALVFVAIALPWVIFATAYYGSPLPQSAVTKFHRSGLFEYLTNIAGLVGETVVPFSSSAPWSVLAWVIVAFGGFVLARQGEALALYVAYVCAHAVAYLYLRPFIGHDWQLYPLQLGAVLMALGGLAFLSRGARVGRVQALAIAALCAVVLAASVRTAIMAGTYRDSYWTGSRHQVYLHLARYLHKHAQPGDAFAAVEVGTLAYYTGMRVYDMGGLVTDTARVNSDRAVRWLVLDDNYLWMAPPWEPAYYGQTRRFTAFVFHVPVGKQLTFPRVETLAPRH